MTELEILKEENERLKARLQKSNEIIDRMMNVTEGQRVALAKAFWFSLIIFISILSIFTLSLLHLGSF